MEATEQKAAHNDRMGVFLCALRFDLYGLCVKSVAFVCGCATPRQKSGVELDLWVKADSVLSVPSCKNSHSRVFAFFAVSFCLPLA